MGVFSLFFGIIGIILTIYFFVTLSAIRKNLEQINYKMGDPGTLNAPETLTPEARANREQSDAAIKRRNRRDGFIVFVVLGLIAAIIYFSYRIQ